MISFILDGKTVQGEEGEYVLQVAERYKVDIPTLCHHKALEPAGMCRLCTVLVSEGRWSKFVTACNYPIWEGMEIQTDNEAIHQIRKLIVELLYARCPDVKLLKELADKYDIVEPRFSKEDDTCILCGLCTRICERMGNSAISLTGRGTEMRVDTPFHLQTEACLSCGACVSVCPTGHITYEKILSNISKDDVEAIPSEYDMGLAGRKPVYVPYAQAVPNTPVIDRTKCIHFKTGGCQICVEFCGVNAIDHKQIDEVIELDVGSIIIAPGTQSFDPAVHDTFGYKKHSNIVTSLEFERILSASGPYGGHLVRPSDHKEPEKIAWLQCIGSRDEHLGAHGYCSGVCCTYAIKEAMLAKDHASGDLDAAIFYIDIRTYGKDFERYYNRAKDEVGVRFVKSKVTNVIPDDDTGKLLIRYVDEAGKRVEEGFDIVVLSIGLMVSPEGVELAKRLGVDMDHYNFAQTSSFAPVESNQPGIYVCGAFEAPKDIPASVVDASAAAGVVGSRLAEARWTLTKTKDVPAEIDVRGELPRVGVFVCRCGTNIAGVVDVPAVAEFAKDLPGVVFVEENMFSCSQDTQEKMTEVIKEHKLNRVVVAACTPKTHEPLFQETLINAGINKYLFEMSNIRNQCSWVHKNDPEEATEKSKDMVKMAVAKAALLQPLTESTMAVTQSVLVIGGGVAGMAAAQNMAQQGYKTFLIEKTDALGGQARSLHETWRGENIQQHLNELTSAVGSHNNIETFLNAEIKQVEGFVGNFKTTIQSNGSSSVLEHGVTIIASGASELKTDQYLCGQDSRVVTGLELQKRFIENDPALVNLKSAVFVQCVGSRVPERPYCSKVCCTQSIKSALQLKEKNPGMDVYILYRDMRPYGLREDLYRQARSSGIVFVRYDSDKDFTVEAEQKDLKVAFSDRVLGRLMEIRPDLLILASAIVPAAKNPLAQLYKVPLNQDGFFAEAHVKLRPVDFATGGVFVCGLAHAPKTIDESITQAQAAAARAITVLAKKEIQLGGIISHIIPELCSGCLGCVNVCPFNAIDFDAEKFVAEVNPALCKGCGACSATCPSEAPELMGFDNNQLYAQINSALCF
ncbi:MAG: FAD-dependent oxidoreductase [Desulfobacterales bacterium]|uniref:FAD-dependent oxidoreductase n=1 Tax=Candidatus Desulfatibia vada TaxID=2841696 RepID=A0A8J6TSX3_9BACT|nr:FAD-dependent oxidoreductase [Candidatus Desulfatibia vada]